MYGTQHVIRQCIEPGMIVIWQGKEMRASAVKENKFYAHNLVEAVCIKDEVVEIKLNKCGCPEVMK